MLFSFDLRPGFIHKLLAKLGRLPEVLCTLVLKMLQECFLEFWELLKLFKLDIFMRVIPSPF